ncbi:MAG: FadR/GntR family transcriptional regulator [Thermodesulfobacteriota bacterium]
MASIKRKKLADYVIEEINRRIQNGELSPGAKLPNQNEFAAQLGVSRPSLREALHTLSLLGLVEQRQGAGTVIRGTQAAEMAEHVSPPLVSDEAATLELVEARRFLETGVVELAVERATMADVRRLGRLVKDMTIALKEDRTDEYTQLDMAFHYAVAAASHNRFLVHLFVTIRGLMEQFMRETFGVLPGLLERSLGFHAAIYEGIKARDPKKAVLNMRNHIRDIEGALRRYYQKA